MKRLLLPVIAILFSIANQAQELASASNNYYSDEIISNPFDTIKNKKGQILKEITITGNKPQKLVSATRSGIKPMDLPQSVQVIDNEIISEQQAIRLSEVIKNANGVYVGSARGGAQESFWSRGYDMTTNNMLKNGFRYNGGSIPEVSSLERVEFLKGGSALLFGNVTPGGILNLVTKAPKFTQGGEILLQAGSFDYYKPSLDYYGPINKSIAYRLTGSYENSESFRNFVTNDRTYFNPSLLFKISDKTQITAQGDYMSADWTPDFGTGIIGKEILKTPRHAYYGALWSTGNTKSASASILLNHEFNKDWKLNFNSSFQNYKRTQTSTSQLSNLDTYAIRGDWKRGLTKNDNREKIFGNQLSLQGIFSTGEIKHQIFTGVDFENSITTSYTFAFFNSNGILKTTEDTAINLFEYNPSTQSTVNPYTTVATTYIDTNYNRFGAYAQDLISFTDYIKVLAGVRWSWQESQANTYNITATATSASEAPKRVDNAFSPKIGLVVQPSKDISLFASYSNSFTPNTGNTYDDKPLKPSIIDQYETGIKTDFLRGFLSTNVTLYIIKNNNLVQTAPFEADGTTPNTNSNLKIMNGETKSKGVEVDVTARPFDGFKINAGYSYNDMRFVNTPIAVNNNIAGDRVARTPTTTANLSFFYTVPSGKFKGISVGAIGNYNGNRIAGWNNRYIVDPNNSSNLIIQDREVPVDGYATIDASIGYTLKKFSIICKLSNITNELNYTVHENYSANPIAPRQIMTSVKYKF